MTRIETFHRRRHLARLPRPRQSAAGGRSGARHRNIFTAAVLGDEEAVRRFLARDPANATARHGPFGGDALTYLCLSKYLRLEPARTPALLRAATALLDGGADAKSGFWTTGEHPEFETALYGAAGVAHHPEMTALLLARGADPNDDDTVVSLTRDLRQPRDEAAGRDADG